MQNNNLIDDVCHPSALIIPKTDFINLSSSFKSKVTGMIVMKNSNNKLYFFNGTSGFEEITSA